MRDAVAHKAVADGAALRLMKNANEVDVDTVADNSGGSSFDLNWAFGLKSGNDLRVVVNCVQFLQNVGFRN